MKAERRFPKVKNVDFSNVVIAGTYDLSEMTRRYNEVSEQLERRFNGLNYENQFIRKTGLINYNHYPS